MNRTGIRIAMLAGTILPTLLFALAGAQADPYFRFNLGKGTGVIGQGTSGGTGGGTSGGTTGGGTTGGSTGGSTGGTTGGTTGGGTTGGSTGGTGGTTGGTTGTGTTPTAQTQDELGFLKVSFDNYSVPVVGQDATGSGRANVFYQKGNARFVAVGLPPGLSLDQNPEYGFAQVVGTPTQSGPFSGTLTATDDNGQTGSTPFTLNVSKAPGTPGPADFFVPALDGLYLDQPFRGSAQYLPLPDGVCVTYTLKDPTNTPLPPGMSLATNCHQYEFNLFPEGQNAPTLAADYGTVVITATPNDGSPPVDSAPVRVRVNQPDLSAESSPKLVRVDPGQFEGTNTFRGRVIYGGQDLRDMNYLTDSNVTLNGTPPDGLTWNGPNLSFDGAPTRAGQSSTMTFTVNYKGQSKTSAPFTIQVNNVLSPYVVYNDCFMRPPMQNPFTGETTPGGPDCELRNADPDPEAITVSYMTDPFVRVLEYGNQPITVALGAGSALPVGLTMNARGEIRGKTSATGDYPAIFTVSAPGLPTRTLGPYTLRVGGPETQVDLPPNWVIPDVIPVTVPYVQGYPSICYKLDMPASEGPYSNLVATGTTPHMEISSDGTVCSVGYGSPQAAWDAQEHQSNGTVSVTKGDGTRVTKSVSFSEMQTLH